MKLVHSRVRVNTWINEGLHTRLVKFSKLARKSKTQIVEESLDLWLTKREKEY